MPCPCSRLLFVLCLSNRRTGAATTSFDGGYGDGTSDVFIVTLSDYHNHFARTTSAVQVITVVGDNSTER